MSGGCSGDNKNRNFSKIRESNNNCAVGGGSRNFMNPAGNSISHGGGGRDGHGPAIASTNATTTGEVDHLIQPRKLSNPVKECDNRKNLHREFMFNLKMGRSVIGQKSELEKKLEEQRRKLKMNN